MPRPRVNLPSVADYIAAIIEAEGPYSGGNNRYFANPDDAERQRRWLAEAWVADDARRVKAVREMQEHAA